MALWDCATATQIRSWGCEEAAAHDVCVFGAPAGFRRAADLRGDAEGAADVAELDEGEVGTVGVLAAAACADGMVRVFDLRRVSTAATFGLSAAAGGAGAGGAGRAPAANRCIALATAATTCVVAGNDEGEVGVWDLRNTGTPLTRFGGYGGAAVTALAAAPLAADGSGPVLPAGGVWVGTADGECRLWRDVVGSAGAGAGASPHVPVCAHLTGPDIDPVHALCAGRALHPAALSADGDGGDEEGGGDVGGSGGSGGTGAAVQTVVTGCNDGQVRSYSVPAPLFA